LSGAVSRNEEKKLISESGMAFVNQGIFMTQPPQTFRFLISSAEKPASNPKLFGFSSQTEFVEKALKGMSS
jgi:hypothetical protein